MGKSFLVGKEKGIFHTRLKQFSKECRGEEGRDELPRVWERLWTWRKSKEGRCLKRNGAGTATVSTVSVGFQHATEGGLLPPGLDS